jgi:hypothetical protein
LKVGWRIRAVRKNRPQMFHSLPQRIILPAGWRQLLPAKSCSHVIQPTLQPVPQPIDRFQSKGQAQFFNGGFDGKPGQHSTNHRDISDALSVWRGKTSASTRENVFPQPLRYPRLEQNTCWPRTHWPLACAGSLPRRILCRFSVSIFPQRGQRCCLSEKAGTATHHRRAQNEIGNETREVLLPKERANVEKFLRHCLTAGLGGVGIKEKGRTAPTALLPHSDHKLTRIHDANSAQTRHFL